jgi:CDP-paratose 2-epimerase
MTLASRRTRPRILITGGAGFIGTNLADRLAREGAEILVYDNLSRGGVEENYDWLKSRHRGRVTLLEGDVRAADVVKDAVKTADQVFHFAAQVAVTNSLADPIEDFAVNAEGTLNVLEAIRRQSRRPFLIYTSTNKVYGGLGDLPMVQMQTRHVPADPELRQLGVSESQPLDFCSPYGCSKGAADQYVRDYARIYGLPTIVFRQSCIYGPRQMGVEDQGWVAWFVIALIMGRPITIFGDGKQLRDLLYVDDLLRAFDLAIDRIEITRGQTYNIGGGPANAISVWWEFKRFAEAVLDRPVPDPAFVPARLGDQPVFIANTTKAQRDFGWAPTISAPEGIRRLAAWVTEHCALFA